MLPFSPAAVVLSQFATFVLGGIVTFDPPLQTVNVQDLPTTVSFAVALASELTLPDGVTPKPIDAFDVVFASDWGPTAFRPFQFAPPLLPDLFPRTPGPFCIGDSCFGYIGGAFRRPLNSPLTIGTMSIDVPADALPGTYGIFLDPVEDSFSSLLIGTTNEPLFGEAFIHVIPEPATLALLACGVAAMAISRRRFSFRA